MTTYRITAAQYGSFKSQIEQANQTKSQEQRALIEAYIQSLIGQQNPLPAPVAFHPYEFEVGSWDSDGKYVIKQEQLDNANLPEGFDTSGWQTDRPIFPPITQRQLRLALLSVGITETDIDLQINLLPANMRAAALLEWNHSSHFDRDHQLVASIGTAMGWTEQQLDDLWLTASQI